MKKLLLFLLIAILTTGPVLAAEKIGTWTQMPITVYIQENRRDYLMKKAFGDWQSATNKVVEFEFVDTPDEAQIVVTFEDKVSDRAENAVGLTYPYVDNNGHFTSAKIIIAKYSDHQSTKMSNHQLMKIMRHEIGHAIGLEHTDSPNSIMNPTTNKCLDITKDDIKLLRAIYGAD